MDSEYKSKIKALIKYSCICLLFYIIAIFPIYIKKESDLRGVNTVLCFFSLPCSILYLRIRKQNNIFLYCLLFANVVLENILISIFDVMFVILPFLSMFTIRNIYLYLVLKQDIMNKILEKTSKSHFAEILIIISVAFPVVEIYISRLYPFTIKIINILMIISVLLSYIIVVKIAIRSFKLQDFIDTIYSLSIIILGFRLFVSIIIDSSFMTYIPGEAFFFFSAYNILLIGIFVEITHVLLQNSKLNHDVEEIKEYDRLRGLFFANLSHELKTPINIIFSCNQVLDGALKSNDTEALNNLYKKYDPMIKQNCYRLIRLINNLVDITKINSNFLNMEFHNYDIVSLVENIVLSIVPYAENKNINVVFDTYVEELEVKCDADSIERIVLNLLSNAIKFSSKDGNILVTMDSDLQYVIIKVIDNGIGIPKEKIEIIFDTFVQADKGFTRANEGSGIGLSLVKSLVELHGGIVYVGHTSSSGSEFVVKIPNTTIKDEPAREHINKNNIINKINIEFSDIYE